MGRGAFRISRDKVNGDCFTHDNRVPSHEGKSLRGDRTMPAAAHVVKDRYFGIDKAVDADCPLVNRPIGMEPESFIV